MPFPSLMELGSLIGTFGNNRYAGGVLGHNGRIYGIPHDATAVLCIDPASQALDSFGNIPVQFEKFYSYCSGAS